MDISRDLREELKELSKEVFGKTSKYQKLFEQQELVTKKVTETVPGENGEPDIQREVTVPVLLNGAKQFRMVYRTPEQVLELLKEFKAKRDEFLAKMKADQEAAAAKAKADADAKKLQEDLGGSAL